MEHVSFLWYLPISLKLLINSSYCASLGLPDSTLPNHHHSNTDIVDLESISILFFPITTVQN